MTCHSTLMNYIHDRCILSLLVDKLGFAMLKYAAEVLRKVRLKGRGGHRSLWGVNPICFHPPLQPAACLNVRGELSHGRRGNALSLIFAYAGPDTYAWHTHVVLVVHIDWLIQASETKRKNKAVSLLFGVTFYLPENLPIYRAGQTNNTGATLSLKSKIISNIANPDWYKDDGKW